MDAQTAQEEADQRNGYLILAAQIPFCAGLFHGNAAAQADICIGGDRLTAVGTIGSAVTGLNTAFQANRLVIIHNFAAIFTKHSNTSVERFLCLSHEHDNTETYR